MFNLKKISLVVLMGFIALVFVQVALAAYSVNITEAVACGAGQRTISGTATYDDDSFLRVTVNGTQAYVSNDEPVSWNFLTTLAVGTSYTIVANIHSGSNATKPIAASDTWTFTHAACPSVTPTLTPTPSVTPTLTPTPSVTPTLTPTPSVTPTLTLTPTLTVTPVKDKVTICHATDSVSNPYVRPEVDADAADGDTGNDSGQGDHSEHTGPVPANEAEAQALKDAKEAWGDIIPPHHNYGGLNWTAQGQAVYNNNCNYATVSPTPTPTPTVTVTPTPTVTVTPTPTVTVTPTPTPGTGGGVAGTSTGPKKEVLGLSATSGSDSKNNELALLFASFILLAVGARLTIKNA